MTQFSVEFSLAVKVFFRLYVDCLIINFEFIG